MIRSLALIALLGASLFSCNPATEEDRIRACLERKTLQRWSDRAGLVAAVSELFDGD